VTVLGAGASAEAKYPTAANLLDLFKVALRDASGLELEEREKTVRRLRELEPEAANAHLGETVVPTENRPQTTGEWFEETWARFAEAARRVRPLAVPRLLADGSPELPSPVVHTHPSGLPGFPPYPATVEGDPPSPTATPYLETFFSHYDDYMRPTIAATQGDPSALRTYQHRFRTLRKLAVETAFREFSAFARPPATYLRNLLYLHGPGKDGCAIATLNFDVTVEQIASESSVALWDGFALDLREASIAPAEWNEPGLENLGALWMAVTNNCHEFQGFECAPAGANLLLKLHGSLGWYVLEEGGGDIGSRDELRHNTVYGHFRLPYDNLWRPEMQYLVDQLASGGPNDPVTRAQTRSLSRKAGSLWVRPYLAFARALKAHHDRLSIELMVTFARLLDRAARVLVIGYSWADPHVNDLIFEAVAKGATLINVSREAFPPACPGIVDAAVSHYLQRSPATTLHVRRRCESSPARRQSRTSLRRVKET